MKYDGHKNPCNHCAVSSDSKFLISTSSDLKVCLHDVKTGKLLFELQINDKIPVDEETPEVEEIPDRTKK